MAIPHKTDLDSFEADVRTPRRFPWWPIFISSADIAIEAARRGAAKLRINPGNIGGLEPRRTPVLDAAGEAGIPIRIGVNAGSLDVAAAPTTQRPHARAKARALGPPTTCELLRGHEASRDLVVCCEGT